MTAMYVEGEGRIIEDLADAIREFFKVPQTKPALRQLEYLAPAVSIPARRHRSIQQTGAGEAERPAARYRVARSARYTLDHNVARPGKGTQCSFVNFSYSFRNSEAASSMFPVSRFFICLLASVSLLARWRASAIAKAISIALRLAKFWITHPSV